MHPLTFLIAFCVACVSWVHAGTRSEFLGMLPWFALMAFITTLVMPQRKRDESLDSARRRVAASIFRDPVFYAFLVLLLLLWVQNLNSPRVPNPIEGGKPLTYKPPPVPWLPWSVSPLLSMEYLQWFLMAFGIVMGVRHGMLKAGRRQLLLFCVWNGAALALFGIIQFAWQYGEPETFLFGTKMRAYHFATFGYQNHAGMFFTFLFFVSLGVLFHRIESDGELSGLAWVLAVPVVLNFTGALMAVSRASILMSVAGLVGFCFYAYLRFWPSMPVVVRLLPVMAAGLLASACFGFFHFQPDNMFSREFRNTDWQAFFQNRVLHVDADEAGGYQVPVAYEIWKDHPVFGVGAWGYKFFVSQYLPVENWRWARGTGQANVHNDFVQYLCEHGVVGAAMISIVVLALLFAVVKPLFQYQVPEYTHSVFLFRLPFVSLMTLAAAVAMILDSIIDIPFRSPPCIAVWCIGLLCASAFTPASWRKKRLDPDF